MITKQDYIKQLNLEPHPEGGWYKQLYHSEDTFFAPESRGDRYRYTSILFLLDYGSPSHFHRLNHDELWYFHAGKPIIIHCIDEIGKYSNFKLGSDILHGEQLQFRVPKNTIFASEVADPNSFAVVSCMVSPGFDFHDFELFHKADLAADYPIYKDLIDRLGGRMNDTNKSR